MDSYGLPLRCTQNPTISEEWRRGWHPETPALSQQRQAHLIVGSGPAGLETAVTLLKAGQKVTIAEARDEPGGRVTREARLPGLSSWARVRDHRLSLLKQSADAELFLSSSLSAAEIAEFGADTVTLATGARWRSDGVGATNFTPRFTSDVYSPDHLMDGALDKLTPASFVVYDDDNFYMASVLVEQLSKLGHRVTYVTPQAMVATWTDFTLDQGRIIQRLRDLNVAMHPNTQLGEGRSFVDVLSGKPVDFGDAHLLIVGARLSEDDLFCGLQGQSNIGTLYRAGDCVSPGTIQNSVFSGHKVARDILRAPSETELFRREQFIGGE
jgi:dimethylamine/trimethylamine dehydrogenase